MDYSKQIDQILKSAKVTEGLCNALLTDLLDMNTTLIRTVEGMAEIILTLDPEYIEHNHARLEEARAQDEKDRETIRSDILRRYGVEPTKESMAALQREIAEYEGEHEDAYDDSQGRTHVPAVASYTEKVLVALYGTDLQCDVKRLVDDMDLDWRHPLDRSVPRPSKTYYPEIEEDRIERLSAESADGIDRLRGSHKLKSLVWIASSAKGNGWFL